MTTDYRTTHSWKAAIDLAPHILRLAEALPEHEQSGLVLQLHQIMLDLPTRIAQDLADATKLRFEVVYRLGAALEVIDRVYPALDTAEIRIATNALAERLSGEQFDEVIPEPAPVAPEPVEPALHETSAPSDPQLDAQAAVAATFAPSIVAPAEPTLEAQLTETVPYAPAVTPAESIPVVPTSSAAGSEPTTVNVQPDSVQ